MGEHSKKLIIDLLQDALNLIVRQAELLRHATVDVDLGLTGEQWHSEDAALEKEVDTFVQVVKGLDRG